MEIGKLTSGSISDVDITLRFKGAAKKYLTCIHAHLQHTLKQFNSTTLQLGHSLPVSVLDIFDIKTFVQNNISHNMFKSYNYIHTVTCSVHFH